MAKFFAGEHLVKPPPFDEMIYSQMVVQPMDSEFYVSLSKVVSESMRQELAFETRKVRSAAATELSHP